MPEIDELKSRILTKLEDVPENERESFLELFEEYDRLNAIEGSRKNFIDFVKFIWPEFISGWHHKKMADAFDRVISGDLKRLIVNMPPRHTKSEFASFLLPAYYLGKYPNRKILMTSHTADLSVDFGRRVRNLVGEKRFQDIFPGISLQQDSQAAYRWHTNKGGVYFAAGVGAKLAGRGADLFIIDDAHSEQEYILGMGNPDVYNKAFEWYTSGPRQRLQPGAAIVIVMTRWSKIDLTGRLISQMVKDPKADQWELIEFPAELPSGNILWPEFWTKDELEKTKASITIAQWNAQYQQNPSSEAAAILKREWWRPWESKELPPVEFVMSSWDTAFEKTEIADYTACTLWGVFNKEEEDGTLQANLILLDAFKGKWEFPELKKIVKKHYEKKEPDMLLVEKKAAGAPLIYELRAMNVPVSEYTPVRGSAQFSNDKISRANSVAAIFQNGRVWYPVHKKYPDEVIEECATFQDPGSGDDYTDTVTQALLRFRQGGFIRTTMDEWEEEVKRKRKRKAYY